MLREHLLSRGLDPDRPGVLLDEEKCIATFLLFNLSGQIVGYQQYNPNGTKQIRNDEKHREKLKYFTFAGNEGDPSRPGKKKLVAWGIESLDLDNTVVFITEGVFDAVKLQNAGLPALAVIANDPQHLRPFFRALGRRVVAICDRDSAGGKLSSCADVSFFVPEPYHDLGEMPQPVVNAFVRSLG